MAGGFESKIAVATLMLISILTTSHGLDTRIVSGPHCANSSDDMSYNKNVVHLLDNLVHETKNVRKGDHEDYTYYHNYPSNDAGAVAGGAVCDGHLWKTSCKSCLATARSKLNYGCGPTTEASIKLEECSMWFKKIVP